MARPKHVKASPIAARTGDKTPRAATFPPFNTLRPAWRFAKLEVCEPFGWHEISGEKLKGIVKKLGEFEALTWGEILVAQKHRNHAISVEQLSSTARQRLVELKLDDVEDLVSLRLSGPNRVFGIRDGDALLLLWWDPDHGVCPSPLK